MYRGVTCNSGTITIGGSAVVDATSGTQAAGIGGGYRGDCDSITISGNAKVYAVCLEAQNGYGAGIGGGAVGACGTITIEGSPVV
jgi:hypothetical protein